MFRVEKNCEQTMCDDIRKKNLDLRTPMIIAENKVMVKVLTVGSNWILQRNNVTTIITIYATKINQNTFKPFFLI